MATTGISAPFDGELDVSKALRFNIFHDRRIAWEDIILAYSLTERDAVRSSECRFETFPLPGQFDGGPIGEIAIDEAGIAVPSWGSYALIGDFGVTKFLALDPEAEAEDRILSIARFATAASWHAGCDTSLVFDGMERAVPRYDRLLAKLFHSDQPLGLRCGHIVDCLAILLDHCGFDVRKVAFANDLAIQHIFLEAKAKTAERWVFVDPDFGVAARRDGILLSAQEICDLNLAGETDVIELVDIAGKTYTAQPRNYGFSFSGQIAWRPEFMLERAAPTDSYYRNTVIEKGFCALRSYDFVFGGAPDYRVRSRAID